MMSAIVAPVFLLVAANIVVHGEASCPTPAQIEQALRALPARASAATSSASDVLTLEDANSHVVARLISPQGQLIGEKRLPRDVPCEDIAAAVALSVAMWRSDIHASYVPQLSSRARSPELPTRSQWSVGAGLGVGTSINPAAVHGEVVLTLLWLVTEAASLRMAIIGESLKTISLGPAEVRWRRTAMALGWQQQLWASRRLAVFGDVQLAWLQVRGDGFATNRSDATLDPGAALGLRWEQGWGRSRLWTDVGARAWPRGHTVVTPTDMPARPLPVTELFVRVGLALTP